MNRTLEEILNSTDNLPIGVRVFNLIYQKWGCARHLETKTSMEEKGRLKIEVVYESEGISPEVFDITGRLMPDTSRIILTEQEAYELFPSLKPKVYEYQVAYRWADKEKYSLSTQFYTSIEDWWNSNITFKKSDFFFVEFYQPSKRERKS